MISVYRLKPAFQNLLRPISNALVSQGISPNAVTLFTCSLSLCVAALLYLFPDEGAWAVAIPVFMFCRMALNAIDGMMAKEHRLQTSLGCILNETTDVIADCALLLSLCAWNGVLAPLMVLLTLLAVMTEIIGLCAVQLGVARRHDGPMGKSDRAFVFSLLIIFAALGLLPAPLMNGLLALMGILLVMTCIKRGTAALSESAKQAGTLPASE